MAKAKPIKIAFKRLKTAWGYAYPDEHRIELDPTMKPERMMEVAIHEVAHVILPDIDESAILRLGKHAADVLLRLGFTRTKHGDE